MASQPDRGKFILRNDNIIYQFYSFKVIVKLTEVYFMY